ncbi:SCP-like protein [Ancylostoma caninum]|uniref:SCP-like protein n=1 Tax=Ancylostoma caninum TaxID=29170 RepID=A0A368H6P3_ANCCA|nr:SCP-like protein [Ancylostoma caninum]
MDPPVGPLDFKYNCELELKARDHSRKCVPTASDPATRPNTEENIYVVAKSDVPNRVAAIELGVKAWWKKVRKDKPIGPALIFRDHHQSQPIRKFTKMAWATTSEIGCAVRDCGSNYVVVCHYSPGGNIVGQQIYRPGAPCGSCPANAQCNRQEGLCVLP